MALLFRPSSFRHAAHLRPNRAIHVTPFCRFPPKASSLVPPTTDISRIRNIGIFAHIDSGKTTLTESVLVHSGYIPHPGTVDLGTTSTDFLPAERERGITIQSASIPVQWSNHTVNLVDTPGHVDFTMEVERAARVVDGAVIVMDGVEGVEGQTEGVWKQLTRYDVAPRILFINKLDRPGASLPHSLTSTQNRLHPLPLLLTLPITTLDSKNGKGGEPGIVGLVDIVNGKIWKWEGKRGEEVKTESRIFDEFKGDGQGGEIFQWDEPSQSSLTGKKKSTTVSPSSTASSFLPLDHPIRQEAIVARTALIETLSTYHLPLLEEFFDIPSPTTSIPSHLLLPPSSLKAAIRALTLQGKVLPVLCGSAFKGMGTELVLDGVVDYLPSPGEVAPAAIVGGDDPITLPSDSETKSGKAVKKKGAPGWKNKIRGNKTALINPEKRELFVEVGDKRVVALAFKVVWDDMRGWMTFVRVYSGTLTKEALFNTTVDEPERPSKLLLLYASQPIEVNSLPAGSIGVLLGLKHTRTGDTLLSANDPRRLPPTPTRLRGVEIPSAVCSVAIQIGGKEEEKIVGEALDKLVRQDPSLRLERPSENEEAGMGQGSGDEGQTLLHGMGPLHLEISLNRLDEEHGVKVRSGKMRVSMKESVFPQLTEDGTIEVEDTWEGTVVGLPNKVEASVKISIQRLSDQELFALRASSPSVSADINEWGGNEVSIDIDPEDPLYALLPSITSSLYACITRGGPLMGLPFSHLRISLEPISPFAGQLATADTLPTSSSPKDKSGSPSPSNSGGAPASSLPPPAAYARAINQALQKAVRLAGPTVLEPLVETHITGVGPTDLGKVVADVVARGGTIQELGDEADGSGSPSEKIAEGEVTYVPPGWVSPSASVDLLLQGSSAEKVMKRTIVAIIPLAAMSDYSGKLRSLSAGGGTFQTRDGGWGEVEVSVVRKRDEED
ncbi:Mitochondrial elongation factor [Phaffia rhodozyma]|uniref:Mitochondrial elongation factor n=1 Tax=Phaffia rhodozyma TaxID=264483 RepID=A0A0F7SST2_PHARH|nr:Mitochondrial elongation factor [Phaffia rhodozyma]